MAIKRYVASKDTTIANAFKSDLSTRGTGSNMGGSDIIETFVLYGQASGSTGLSAEKSRILLQFPTSDLSTDRTAGSIPASGSVTWYLRLYNAPHSQNVAENMYLAVHPLSSPWDEGRGLDMESYGYDGQASWEVARSGSSGMGTTATATVTVANEGWVEAGDTIALVAADGTSVVCTMHADTTTSTAATTTVQAARNGGSTSAVASAIATAINYSSYFSATAADNVVTITQATGGLSGNTTITITEGGATGFSKTDFTDGDGIEEWTTEGGDYTDTGKYGQLTASFTVGTEDVEMDVSSLVEDWLKSSGGITDYGVIIKPAPHVESAVSSSYTKKFFARGTEFFFKRPVLEARWDSAVKDDRTNFYFSSSLASHENVNNLYFYNYIRGQLKTIPGYGGSAQTLTVKLFSGSLGYPTGSALKIKKATVTGDGTGGSNIVQSITATETSTSGVYKAQIMLTSSEGSPDDTGNHYLPSGSIYDIWYHGSSEIHTGSAIDPKRFDRGYAQTASPTPEYIVSPTNFKTQYSRQETARMKFYVRKKNWSPTIYTIATQTMESETLDSGSYRVRRVIDGVEAVPFGTSSILHTQMSYDSSGSYFDLDMSMLEAGYSYSIDFAYYNGSIGDWVEIPAKFKFRLEE